jgi:hypothetical protein
MTMLFLHLGVSHVLGVFSLFNLISVHMGSNKDVYTMIGLLENAL